MTTDTDKEAAAPAAKAKKAKAAKKPAKAKKAKVAKKAKAASKGRRAKYSDNAKITLLIKENPRRKGTAAYDKFAKFRSGMTVGEFIKAGERHEDWNMRGTLDSSVKRGQISIKEVKE